jgi:hypothetical protein
MEKKPNIETVFLFFPLRFPIFPPLLEKTIWGASYNSVGFKISKVRRKAPNIEKKREGKAPTKKYKRCE